MIITVVCDVLGEENNGTTVAAMNLIKFLQQKGHTVRILCADQARKNQENVFVVPNYNFGKILNDYVHKVGVTLAKPDEEIVRNAIDGADIVHIMMPYPRSTLDTKNADSRTCISDSQIGRISSGCSSP